MAEGESETQSGEAAGPAAAATVPDAAASPISEEEVSALLEKAPADGVRPFDMTAERINRMQLPMLEVLCKTFADRSSATLCALLGRDVAVHFGGLESAKAAELQARLPAPSSLASVRLKPMPGIAFVSVEPALLLSLLDGFFGGTGRAINDTAAAIAPAALRFLALILRSFAPDLTAAWAPVTPVELELVKQETNPRLMQLGNPQDLMLVLKFSAEFGAGSGRIDWLIPETLLSPIREMLASEGGNAPVRAQKPWAPVLGSSIQEAEVETRAVLAEAEISLRDLVRLAPGDIIPIDAPQQVQLLAGEVPLYRGRFGISQGRNALKILPGGNG